MGGLGRTLPWTCALFALGAVAISGLPPLNGFASELVLYLGAFRSLMVPQATLAALVAPLLAVIGALACACFVKVVGTVFLGLPREPLPGHAGECGWAMRAPMVVLACLCVLLGLAPALGVGVFDGAAVAFLGELPAKGAASAQPVPSPLGAPSLGQLVPFWAVGLTGAAVVGLAALLWVLLSRAARGPEGVGTWDCGYWRITPRMQYTGSSFARSLVDLLRFALRPAREGPALAGAFPAPSRYRTHVGDIVLDRWVRPLAERFADACSRLRQRQSQRIQVYIVYVFAVALAGLVVFTIDLIDLLRAAVQ
jgi:NADH:ubiquinone oxidoreductase subunit 5 (subunit L)/multisubunit Na+/H+ antiporter MnhA subunit